MKFSGKYPNRRGGFTLVEIVVVASIIVLLVALSVPVIRKSSDRAQVAKCVSNLRQIGVATMLYAGENDGRLPDKSGPSWVGDLWPYVSQSPYVGFVGNKLPLPGTIFACPSANGSTNPSPKRSYGINVHLVDNNANTQSRLLQIEQPSKSVLYADNARSSYLQATLLAARHGGRCNVVYVDGHAETIELTKDIIGDLGYRSVFWRGGQL